MSTSQTPARRRAHRVLLSCAVAGVTAAAMAVPTSAAGAASSWRVSLADPAGDVLAIGEGEDEEWTSAGDMPTADVVDAAVQHRRSNVVVRMHFADLRREDPAFYTAMIVTPDKFRGAFVETRPGRWGGRHTLVNGSYGTVRCRGFQHSVDYVVDTVTMTLPRRCLGRPRWVRVSMSNYMFRGDSEATFQEITDNPHTADAEGGMTGRLYRAP